jgi:hypothetical protein
VVFVVAGREVVAWVVAAVVVAAVVVVVGYVLTEPK